MSRQRFFLLFILLVLTNLLLAACERSLGGDAAETTPTAAVTGDQTPASGDGQIINTPAPASDTPVAPTPGGEATIVVPTTEVASTTAPVEGETTAPTEAAPTVAPTDTPATSDTSGQTPTAVPTPSGTVAGPVTHTVAVGENLYRIGLQYGVSWVQIAELNKLSNPNQLTVGQVLQIPSGTPSPEPTPSPQTETTYVVKVGDNLFRIGLAYGINWVQIAEANGIVNPNQIYVGQTLKIPVSTPGPTPQFTHQVKAGETLFLISLQYGIPWTRIAEANNLSSPYVIYVGQVLVIPGS